MKPQGTIKYELVAQYNIFHPAERKLKFSCVAVQSPGPHTSHSVCLNVLGMGGKGACFNYFLVLSLDVLSL